MTCSRVIIINKGRIEVLDTPENLRSRLGSEGEVILEARTEDPQAIAKLRPCRVSRMSFRRSWETGRASHFMWRAIPAKACMRLPSRRAGRA